MRELLQHLLSLRSVSLSDPEVAFQFARPLPAYVWAIVVLGCVGIAWWSYARLEGSRGGRMALGTLRALVLLLLAVLIAGPELTKQNERVEKDWVVVMADRSASMMVADGSVEEAGVNPGTDTPTRTGLVGNADGTRSTRDAQIKAAIRDAWPMLSSLARERNVMFLGFDQQAYDLRVVRDGEGTPMGLDLATPQGRRTRIGQSIEQTLRRVAAKPVAGIVLLTDGRSADRLSRATLKQLDARQIRIFPVPLGGGTTLADLAIRRVDAPSGAFKEDVVPVTVEVDALGLGVGEAMPRAMVKLLDENGVVLAERPLVAPARAGEPSTVTLTTTPTDEGSKNWSVVIEPASADLTTDNNKASVRIEVVDRPIRVAYFDGYPRWEHRYLKNLLIRERSVRSSVLLLAGDKRYIQEGTDLLPALPRTQQEWNEYDVIILGDMRPELLSEDQLRQIKSHVAERGCGLLLMGGPGAMPMAWRNTPLADLVPFTLKGESMGSGGGVPTWAVPVTLRRGLAAAKLGVVQLGETADEPFPAYLSDGSLAWTLLRWAQKIDPRDLKPTAEVLATVGPPVGSVGSGRSESGIENGSASGSASERGSEPTPAVLTMRYGAGRVVYVATDEAWRYRYGRGETLPERFWIPLVRLLARESLGRGGKLASLEVSPQKALVEQQVTITLRLLDQTLLRAKPESITVLVKAAEKLEGVATNAGSASDGVEIVLRPTTDRAQDALMGRFTGVFVPVDPGAYVIESRDPTVVGLNLSARFDASYPDDELRAPQPDHEFLAELAQATGGTVLPASRLNDLTALLPNREVKILGTPDVETLWDKPLVLVIFLLLIGIEWIGRRLIKLA